MKVDRRRTRCSSCGLRYAQRFGLCRTCDTTQLGVMTTQERERERMEREHAYMKLIPVPGAPRVKRELTVAGRTFTVEFDGT